MRGSNAMKRKMSVLLALMLLLCSLFAVPVQAETVLKDGLEVTLTTDKESYDALETIYAKLTVKNTNSYDVENVTARIVAPAGCKLDSGNEIKLGTLSAGEVQQMQIDVLEANVEAPILPQTGDDSHGTLWSVLFVVAAAVLCALVIRNPQTKRVISILLCVAIVAPYVLQAVPVQAEAHLAEIIVEKTVSVDGNPVVLTGVVSYEKPGMMLMSLRPFEIVTQPVSQTVSEGSRATFFIEVTGSDIQYQWYYKKPGSSTWTKSSNTTDTYSFTMKESYDGRSIRCKVKDANGETLTSDTVKLALPVAKITTQPKSQTVSAGSTAKFTVKATGDGLKYQWYYKKSGSSTWTKSSNTKATYSLTMKESYDGRSIRCKVTDQYGNTVTSNTVKLTLPVVKITTQPKSQTVDAGSAAKFTVAATGDGLKYQWYYKKSGSSTWTKSSNTKSTYSFTMKESYDGRSIRCKVTDQYGNTATSNTVKLALPAVKITEQPTDQAALVGEKATFTVKAAGYGLTYQWYYKNAGASKWSKSSTGTTATYSFTMKESYDGRQIRCVVTDKNGNTVTSETAKLTTELGIPTGVIAVTQSASSIKITWTKVENATGYYVYRSTNSDSDYSKVKIITSGDTISFEDTGLNAYTTYYYRVSAYNANGESQQSAYTSDSTRDMNVPELLMFDAKIDKSTYAPGETITISGIKVNYANYVRFSGNNSFIASKDVYVTNSSKYVTLSDVTFVLPNDAEEGSFYIDVQAGNGYATSVIDTAFTYTVVKNEPTATPDIPPLDFEYTILNDSVEITAYTGSDNNVIVPDMIEGYPVVCIADKAFYQNGTIESVIIPDTVLALGANAFRECIKLNNITLSKNLTEIGEFCFVSCESLKNIDIPNTVAEIGQGAFVMCTALERIMIPEGVKELHNGTFQGCTGLKKVTLSEGVEILNSGVFVNCVGLESINLPESLTTMGGSVFNRCSCLSSIRIPSQISELGAQVFYGCEKLNSVTLSENMQSIGRKCFDGCSELSGIYISPNVTSIDSGAFNKCADDFAIYGEVNSYAESFANENNIPFVCVSATPTPTTSPEITPTPDSTSTPSPAELYGYRVENGKAIIWKYRGHEQHVIVPAEIDGYPVIGIDHEDGALAEETMESIVIPEGVTYLGEMTFSCCENLISVTLPESLVSIGDYAFECCDKLTDVILPSGLETLGEGAFDGCSSLTQITIPGSVDSVEDYTFRDCTKLDTVVLKQGVKSIGLRAFWGCNDLCDITIPKSVTSIDEEAFYGFEDFDEYFCLLVHKDSFAHQFAKSNGIPYELLDGTEEPESTPTPTTTVNPEVTPTPTPSDLHVTVTGLAINGQRMEITVNEGEKLSFAGTVSASDGASLTAVQASIFLRSDPTKGCKAVRKDNFASNVNLFDLSAFAPIVVGQTYSDPATGQSITMEAGQSYIIMLYAADSNGVGFEDLNSDTPEYEGPYILVHVEAVEPEVTPTPTPTVAPETTPTPEVIPEITKICDAAGNVLSGIWINYLGSSSEVIYVYSNVGTITAWCNSFTNFEFDHQAADLLSDGTYRHLFTVSGTKNTTTNKRTSVFVFYAYANDPKQPDKSRTLATLNVTQEPDPYRAIVESVSLKNSASQVFDINNQLAVANGHHEGYTLIVNMNQEYLTDVFPGGQATWYIYSSDPDTVLVYKKDDGRYYVQAKQKGLANIYISHQYVDKEQFNTLKYKHHVCTVKVNGAEGSVDRDEIVDQIAILKDEAFKYPYKVWRTYAEQRDGLSASVSAGVNAMTNVSAYISLAAAGLSSVASMHVLSLKPLLEAMDDQYYIETVHETNEFLEWILSAEVDSNIKSGFDIIDTIYGEISEVLLEGAEARRTFQKEYMEALETSINKLSKADHDELTVLVYSYNNAANKALEYENLIIGMTNVGDALGKFTTALEVIDKAVDVRNIFKDYSVTVAKLAVLKDVCNYNDSMIEAIAYLCDYYTSEVTRGIETGAKWAVDFTVDFVVGKTGAFGLAWTLLTTGLELSPADRIAGSFTSCCSLATLTEEMETDLYNGIEYLRLETFCTRGDIEEVRKQSHAWIDISVQAATSAQNLTASDDVAEELSLLIEMKEYMHNFYDEKFDSLISLLN